MPTPNAVHNLLKDFRKEYPDWGSTPSPETLLLYKLTRTMSGVSTTPTGSTGGIATAVSIMGSTGTTVLTDNDGRIVVANIANLLGRIPALSDGRIPVGVVFPQNQNVTVTNQLTGVATEQSLNALLQRIPSSTNNRLPVAVEFPGNQQVTVSNQLTGFATQATLGNILTKLDSFSTDAASEQTLQDILTNLPLSIAGRVPVSLDTSSFSVTNQIQGYSTEGTLKALLDKTPTLTEVQQSLTEIRNRLPELDQGKVPVAFTAQANITGFSTEETLSALLNKTLAPVDGKLPVSLTFPSNQSVTVSNQLSGFATQETLASILNKLATPVNGKVPVSLEFPTSQQVTVSNQLDIAALGKDATLTNILNKVPAAVDGKIPVSLTFPTNQAVTVSNPIDVSGLGKDASLVNILNKLPTVVNGKLPVALDFPQNQSVIVTNQPAPLDISGLGKDSTLVSILGKLPTLVNGKTPVEFPANQTVTVSNPSDMSALGKEATLTSILNKLPTLTNGKAQVVLDFPVNQTVTVSNQPTPLDISALSKDSTLTNILNKLPTLINGKTLVDFPTNQTVTVSNQLDVSALSKESTLTSVLNRLPVDLSKAIASGFRSEFTSASPLATTLPSPVLNDSPLWTIARTKKAEGQDSFVMTCLGRRLATFAAGFTDIVEFDLQTVGNNLRSPTLTGIHPVEILSSNAADSSTGTGIRTIEIMYLDENYVLKTTVVTMAGTTAVQVLKDGVAIKPTCILKMQTTSHGSSAGAVGTVILRTPAGSFAAIAAPVDQISVGFTSSFSARTCVPEGYLGYVVDISGVGITANHDFHLLATVAQSDKRLLDGVFSSLDFFTANAGTLPVNRDEFYYELPSRCRVRLASRSSSTTASATGSFTVVFVKKPV
jgi:hypothetical protein